MFSLLQDNNNENDKKNTQECKEAFFSKMVYWQENNN